MDRADDTIGTTAQVAGIEPEQGVSTVVHDTDRPGDRILELPFQASSPRWGRRAGPGLCLEEWEQLYQLRSTLPPATTFEGPASLPGPVGCTSPLGHAQAGPLTIIQMGVT